jgi:diguanylate cyclase (GGDEF)-like protein
LVIEQAPTVSKMSIADPLFRRSLFAFRLLLLSLWVGLARLGILDVSTQALIVSAGIIATYDAFLLLVEIQITRTGRESARINAVVRHLDIVTTTVAMVALHDVRNPVFMIYFVGLVSAAHLSTRREMTWQAVWVTINYLAFAGITSALGHSVSWSYVVVVTIGLQLMGINAMILAGGEQRLRDLIASVAVTDSLTGLPNRRRFHESYPQSIEEAIAQNTPLALMLIDFDKFKDINDKFGHPAGDDKLRDVAQALQSVVRSGDLVARYGGDEFIVVAPHSTRENAQILAERLRTIAHTCGASVSIGLALFPEDAAHQDGLIEAADTALYLAKEAGRNCVRELDAA